MSFKFHYQQHIDSVIETDRWRNRKQYRQNIALLSYNLVSWVQCFELISDNSLFSVIIIPIEKSLGSIVKSVRRGNRKQLRKNVVIFSHIPAVWPFDWISINVRLFIIEFHSKIIRFYGETRSLTKLQVNTYIHFGIGGNEIKKSIRLSIRKNINILTPIPTAFRS